MDGHLTLSDSAQSTFGPTLGKDYLTRWLRDQRLRINAEAQAVPAVLGLCSLL